MAANRRLEYEAPAMRRFFELSLLGMLASGYGALLGSGALGSGALDVASVMLAGIALVVRLLIVTGLISFRIPQRWVNIVTLLYLGFYPLDYLYFSKDFLDATVRLVFFVGIVQIITADRAHDHFFLKLIAFLELLAASIVSTNATFFVFLALFLLCTVATFASMEVLKASDGRKLVVQGSTGFGRRLGWLTGFTAGAILAATIALFFILPRTARAALEHLIPSSQRVSGFTTEVTLGQVGEIRRQGQAVMHFRFDEDIVPEGLKWRGTALAEFNGWKWYNSPRQPGRFLRSDSGLLQVVGDDLRRKPGRRLSYEVVLNASSSDYLFIAGTPEILRLPDVQVMAMPAGGYRIPFVDTDGFHYGVYATLGSLAGGQLSESDRNFNLRLPPLDPRIVPLARGITADSHNDEERARAIENYLKTQFSYSLAALDHEVDDPLAHFLFESRKGHCEYFASAMAVLLRTVWVPARVATGFQSGSYNSISGWHVVRASDAHSWVEAWVPGRGWTSFDPTPPDPNAGGTSISSKLGLWSDALSMFWQEWVMSYDLDRQLSLAFQMQQSRRRFSVQSLAAKWADFRKMLKSTAEQRSGTLAWMFFFIAMLVCLAFAWPLLRDWFRFLARRRRLKLGLGDTHDAAVIYRRMLRRLKHLGIEKAPAQTPAEFALALPHGELAGAVHEFTDCYNAFRYGGRRGDAVRLAALLDKIEQLP